MRLRRLLGLIVAATILPYCGLSVNAESHRKKYEMRAVWLTTVYGLDWPRSSDEGRQKKELIQLLDRLKVAGINTIFLQVRGRGDLIYPSSVEPGNPLFLRHGKFSYDPLAFALEECHKRGFAVHAWLVALPLGNSRYQSALGTTAYAKLWPERTVRHKGERYMDPADPATGKHLRRIIAELLQKYPLDGIHLDYIRYPEDIKRFPDRSQYKRAATSLSLHEWRTQNITNIIREVCQEVDQQCSSVLLSCATVGAYRRRIPNHDAPAGWTAFDDVCQDPVAWAKERIVDFIVPMHYIRGRNFWPIIEDWKRVMNLPVVVGLGAYQLLKSEGGWPVSEALSQVSRVQKDSLLSGVCLFRADQVADLGLRLHQSLRDSLFSQPVLPRPEHNRGDSIPLSSIVGPMVTELDKRGEIGLKISWQDGNDLPRQLYTVYLKHGEDVPDTRSGDDLISVTTEKSYRLPWDSLAEEDFITIRIGAYDVHTGRERIGDEVSYYRRPQE